jgi:peptidoglycan-associated lipoprotein
MQIRSRVIFSLLFVMTALLTLQPVAHAQKAVPASKQPRYELAVQYNFVRSNAPPGSCTCFNLNGGSVSFALPVRSSAFSLVGDASITHGGGISSNGYDLTLSTFTAGARYRPRLRNSPLQPFAQVLVGLGHAGGSLVTGQNPSVGNADAAFAAIAGGGLDLRINRRLSLRLVDADYLATTFQNGVNDHQNNIRLSAGLAFHF